LKLRVFVGHVPKLGRAYKREVSGVEEEYGPLTFEVLVGNCLELVVVIGLDFELGNLAVDNRHNFSPVL
jgi:hypothetical protein